MTVTEGTGTLPTGAGGTLVDGTYFLTKAETFGGLPAGIELREKTVISGNTFELVRDQGEVTVHDTVTGTTDGTTLTVTATCGTLNGTYSYTATPTSYVLYAPGIALTWTKQ